MTKTPSRYDPLDYPAFAVAVDVVVFTIRAHVLHIALVRRGNDPFLGQWALPGGFVLPDENLDQAAARELAEETGLQQEDGWYLEQLASYGDPKRDPRMRVVTVAYLAVAADLPQVRGGGDAVFAELKPVSAAVKLDLAFDHTRIVHDAIERIRSRLEYTTLAARFVERVFTVSELREVYETVWGTSLDKGNFRRNFGRSDCFQSHGYKPRRTRGRPASLWSVLEPARSDHVRLLDRPLATRPVGLDSNSLHELRD